MPRNIPDIERPNQGQSTPPADTGGGAAGVPNREPGISNRGKDTDTDELMKDEDDTDGNV